MTPSITKLYFSVQNFEKLRWPVTMGLLGVFSLFCILLFIGAIVHSRATLIIFSVCGLFSIILLWLLASIYISMAVALADFCYKPSPWIQLALNHSYNLSEEISNYYLTCKNEMNPFEKPLEDSQRTVKDIGQWVSRVNQIARQNYRENELYPALSNLVDASTNAETLIEELVKSLDCSSLIRLVYQNIFFQINVLHFLSTTGFTMMPWMLLVEKDCLACL